MPSEIGFHRTSLSQIVGYPCIRKLDFERAKRKGFIHETFLLCVLWIDYGLENFHIKVAEGFQVITIKILDDL